MGHIAVLTGNIMTGNAISDIGTSVHGWSQVGFGVAEGLGEVSLEKMKDIQTSMSSTISELESLQSLLESALPESTASLLDRVEEEARKEGDKVQLLQVQG